MSRIDGLRRDINELREGSVIRKFRTTAADGKDYLDTNNAKGKEAKNKSRNA